MDKRHMKAKYIITACMFGLALSFGSCTQKSTSQDETATQREKKEVCIQLYSVRDLLKSETDLEPILKQLAEMGYTSVEAANYNDGKFYGMAPADFKALVEKYGMSVLSSHTTRALTDAELSKGDLTEALAWWDKCIADHKAAGMKYIVTPWMDVPKTLKDLQTYCDYYNEVGKRCREAGLKYGYHNHNHEFQKVEGKEVMLDYMLQHTNPENVFFQMDVYWVVRGQNSPVDYFTKYPGRFTMLHIKDHREIGQSGMVGYDAIFRNADKAGTQDIVAEIEQYSCPVMESVKQSLDYLLDAPFVKVSYSK